jgi:hypothetical protein
MTIEADIDQYARVIVAIVRCAGLRRPGLDHQKAGAMLRHLMRADEALIARLARAVLDRRGYRKPRAPRRRADTDVLAAASEILDGLPARNGPRAN